MRKINEIIIHCSATRPGWMIKSSIDKQVAEIKRWHVKLNGWSDIGYHYIIGRNGEVRLGRAVERVGAHTRGRNKNSIGICLIGGYGSAATDSFEDHFTSKQWDVLHGLLNKLEDDYGTVGVHGHNEYAAKGCPGFNVQTEIVDIRAPQLTLWDKLRRSK